MAVGRLGGANSDSDLAVFLFNEPQHQCCIGERPALLLRPSAAAVATAKVAPEGAWRQYGEFVDLLLKPGSSLKPLEASLVSPAT